MEEERYHVIKKLGEGATAQVFLVSDRLLGRNMAVKQGADKALLLAEAKVLASVSHAAFPVLYDYREDETGGSLFMEYIAGENLRQRRERISRYTQEEVVRIVCMTAEAVMSLHEAGTAYVYGDIKPENIMVQPDGRVRLVDLGAAVSVAGNGCGIRINGTAQRGATPLYAAPEAWQGRPDVRNDIYALGRLMQVLLPDSNEKCSAGYRRIVERCVQKSPDCRYGSMREFLKAASAI